MASFSSIQSFYLFKYWPVHSEFHPLINTWCGPLPCSLKAILSRFFQPLLFDTLYCDRTKLHVGKKQFARSATSWAVIFFFQTIEDIGLPLHIQHFQHLQSVQTVLWLFIPPLFFSTIYTYHWVFHDPLWKQSGHLQLILIQAWHNPPPIVSLRTLLLTSFEMVCDENILKLFTKHCTTCPLILSRLRHSAGNCTELYIFGVLQKCIVGRAVILFQ